MVAPLGIISSHWTPGAGLFKRALGSGVTTSSSTTTVITTTGAIDIGDLVVVRIATDNSSSIGPTYTCADSGGNSYVILGHKPSGIATNGSSACTGLMATKATVAVAAGGTITVTNSSATNAKVIYAESYTGYGTAQRGTAAVAGGPSATPSVTSAAAEPNDLVVAVFAVETQTTFAADTDTTGGAWSTQVRLPNATGGTDASRMTVAGQYKIVNAAGAQTYNTSLSTGATTDWGAIIAVLVPG